MRFNNPQKTRGEVYRLWSALNLIFKTIEIGGEEGKPLKASIYFHGFVSKYMF